MLYREAGQFKTSYAADMAVFPIRQDRWLVAALVAAAYVALPLFASDYLFRAILIPFLILSLAAIGLNLLVGYCGQISLGTGGFMAVGAYAAYNLALRVPELNRAVLAGSGLGGSSGSGMRMVKEASAAPSLTMSAVTRGEAGTPSP